MMITLHYFTTNSRKSSRIRYLSIKLIDIKIQFIRDSIPVRIFSLKWTGASNVTLKFKKKLGDIAERLFN